jgi:hypothetical protein
VVDFLPFYDSAVAGFLTGIAINIGVKTLAHRDGDDYVKFCMVIPFGNGQGGEICIVEMGMCFNLCPCEILAFRSGRLTHLNLPHEG